MESLQPQTAPQLVQNVDEVLDVVPDPGFVAESSEKEVCLSTLTACKDQVKDAAAAKTANAQKVCECSAIPEKLCTHVIGAVINEMYVEDACIGVKDPSALAQCERTARECSALEDKVARATDARVLCTSTLKKASAPCAALREDLCTSAFPIADTGVCDSPKAYAAWMEPQFGIELETGSARIISLPKGAGVTTESYVYSKTTLGKSVISRLRYPWIDFGFDHPRHKGHSSIIELGVAPHDMSLAEMWKMYMAVEVAIEVIEDVSKKCLASKSITLEGSEPALYTEFLPAIADFNAKMDGIADGTLYGAAHMLEREDMKRYKLEYTPPKEGSDWWILCGWKHKKEDAYRQGIQLNYGLPLSRLGDQTWAKNMFKKQNPYTGHSDTDDDVVLPNMLMAATVADALSTAIQGVHVYSDQEKADLKGTLTAFLHVSIAKARGFTRRDIIDPDVSGGILKNQQHQLLKVCVNELVTLLPPQVKADLKTWWTKPETAPALLQAIKDGGVALDNEFKDKSTKNELGEEFADLFVPRTSDEVFWGHLKDFLAEWGKTSFEDQSPSHGDACVGNNVKDVRPIKLLGQLGIVVESRVADPMRHRLAPSGNGKDFWTPPVFQEVSEATNIIREAVGLETVPKETKEALQASLLPKCELAKDFGGILGRRLCQYKSQCKVTDGGIVWTCDAKL